MKSTQHIKIGDIVSHQDLNFFNYITNNKTHCGEKLYNNGHFLAIVELASSKPEFNDIYHVRKIYDINKVQ